MVRSTLAQEWIDARDGDVALAALEFARALMEGDAATFKQGYDAANAHIAAASQFELDDDQADALERALANVEIKVGMRVGSYDGAGTVVKREPDRFYGHNSAGFVQHALGGEWFTTADDPYRYDVALDRTGRTSQFDRSRVDPLDQTVFRDQGTPQGERLATLLTNFRAKGANVMPGGGMLPDGYWAVSFTDSHGTSLDAGIAPDGSCSM